MDLTMVQANAAEFTQYSATNNHINDRESHSACEISGQLCFYFQQVE